ncbi:hypothetical protein [Vulcanisaeta distributa]|uniref:hypothetical protein n=1 Tax=Vulcanisaeta distributa TaxID=164451 RepID=UPI000AA7C63E|nr:hypothetical protein [Vulcanisaeta distributa]
MAVAIAFFAVIVLANILGTKYGFRLMTILTTISMIGLVIAIAIMLLTPRQTAIAAINNLLPSGYTYSSLASSYRGA